MKIYLKYLQIILVVVMFMSISISISCKNKNKSNKAILPTEVSFNKQITSLEYDSSNRLVKIIIRNKDQEDVVMKFSYDSQGRVVSDGLSNYEYKDKYILKTNKNDDTIDTLFINKKNQLIKYSFHEKEKGEYAFFLYEYDSKGNIIKSVDVSLFDFNDVKLRTVLTETSTYDDKKGVLSNIDNAYLLIVLSNTTWRKYFNNNISSSKREYEAYEDGKPIKNLSSSGKFLYTYNEEGYPTEAILEGDGELTIDFVYTDAK